MANAQPLVTSPGVPEPSASTANPTTTATMAAHARGLGWSSINPAVTAVTGRDSEMVACARYSGRK